MSDLNITTISGVQCYEENGTVYLDLEAVARGLGFTKKADSGNEVVNWTRVRNYLTDLGVAQKCTTGEFIPENIFYRLTMKDKNAVVIKDAAYGPKLLQTTFVTGQGQIYLIEKLRSAFGGKNQQRGGDIYSLFGYQCAA